MADKWFREAFGASVDDVRQRLVEEAWFGRSVVTPRQQQDRDDHSLSEQFGWGRVLDEKTSPDKAKDRSHLQSLEADALNKQRQTSHEQDFER